MHLRWQSLLVAVAMLPGLGAGPVAAAPSSIADQVRRAVAAGDTEVTIEPGTYRQTDTLSLNGVNAFTVHADGVTLVMTRTVQALATGSSHDLTIEGLTIDYDPLPYTQGRVVGVGSNGSEVDVALFAGYPDRLTGRVARFDPASRQQESWADNAAISWVDQQTRVLRIAKAGSGVVTGAAVGDIVTIAGSASSGASYGITVDGTNVVLRDVTLHAAPGMGLMNAVGGGNLVLDGFQLVPGPPPAGASEHPILSSSWDGIQVQSVVKGPTVRNSRIVNPGDDSFSIAGVGPVHIRAVDGAVVTAEFTDATYRVGHVGDALQQWVDGPAATILAMTRITGSTFRVTLDRPSPWPAGTVVADPDRMGNGFVLEGNEIDGPGRVLIKANHGVIAGNSLRGANAVSVASEIASDSHANAGGNLTITGNDIYSTPGSGGGVWNGCQRGAVALEGRTPTTPKTGEPLYPDMVIEGNRFHDIRGLGIGLAQTRHAIVRGNTFIGPQQVWVPTTNACNLTTTTVINIAEASDVAIADNVVDWVGPYATRTYNVDATTTSDVRGLPVGIEVTHPLVRALPSTAYTLTNRHSNKLLTGSMTGSPVQQPARAMPDQAWRMTQVGSSDWYRIEAPDGRSLTALTGNVVLLTAWSGAMNQMWQLPDTRDGSARILNRQTGGMLSPNAAVSTAGAAIGQFAVDSLIAQDWLVTDVTPVLTADDPPATVAMGSSVRYGFAAAVHPPIRPPDVAGAAPDVVTVAFAVAAGDLPPGMTLNSTTGELSGTPSEAGAFEFVVSASTGFATVSGDVHTMVVAVPSPSPSATQPDLADPPASGTAAQPTPATDPADDSAGGALSVTGADASAAILVAITLLAAGAVLLLAARRRSGTPGRPMK